MADRGDGWRKALWLLAVVPFAIAFFWLTGEPSSPEHVAGSGGEGTGGEAASGAARGADAGVAPSAEGLRDAGPERTWNAAPIRLSEPTIRRDPNVASGALAGTVRAWGSGRGIEGAELTFEHDGHATTVTSGADGGFELVAGEPGEHVMALALAPGFLPFAPEWGHSPVRFTARPGVRVEGVVVYLVDEIRYVVEVVDADGEPVAGASVRVFGAERGERTLAPLTETYATGEDGTVAITAPDDAVLEARHPEAGRGRARVDTGVQVSRRARIALSTEVPPERAGDRAIAGRAVDGEGAPVPDARVLARFDVPGELHPERGATTGDDGAFVLEGLDEGRYELTATAPGRARGRAVAAAGAEGVAIELAAEGRVRVRVLDVDGEPVAAATIVVERAMGDLEQETLAVVSGYDAEGAFDVGGLPLGPCRVVAVAPGFAASEPVSAIAAADPRPTEVRVGRGGTILGRVVSGSDGHPIEGARVTLEGRLGASSSAVPVSSSALTDADGRFELSGAPPGVGSVVAWAADHHGRVRSGIAIAERVRVDIGTLDLSPVEDGEEPRIELAGIGAVLSADQDVLRIGRVVDGGGAAEVGLGAGDAILRIDGAPVGGLGFGGSIERIRGPEGTSVRLEVRRAGAEQSEIIAVPRRRIRA